MRIKHKMCVLKFDKTITKESIKEIPERITITVEGGINRIVGSGTEPVIEEDGIYYLCELNASAEILIEKDGNKLLGYSIGVF